jgi:hypothetical protein
MYSYIDCRNAHKMLDGDLTLNVRTITPPVCTVPDTDNRNLKWFTAVCNVCLPFVAAECSYPVIPS